MRNFALENTSFHSEIKILRNIESSILYRPDMTTPSPMQYVPTIFRSFHQLRALDCMERYGVME